MHIHYSLLGIKMGFRVIESYTGDYATYIPLPFCDKELRIGTSFNPDNGINVAIALLKASLVTMALALFLFVMYVGITNDLCSRIDTFDAMAQASMKLSVSECAKLWYVR
jgi:hypothetical protein